MAWPWDTWQNQGPFELARFSGFLVSSSFYCWPRVLPTGCVTLGKSFSLFGASFSLISGHSNMYSIFFQF